MMTLTTLKNLLAIHGSAMWQGRTTDEEYGEEDTHLTAWAWVDRPDEVELAGATVEVRHRIHTGGEWVPVTADAS